MDEKDEKDGAAAETAPPAVGTETPAGAGNDARARDAQETGDSTAESKGRPLLPSEHFTGHQKFYIFALDGVGGMTLSAGVNFAIAYGN